MHDQFHQHAMSVARALADGTAKLDDAMTNTCQALMLLNAAEASSGNLGMSRSEAKTIYQSLGTIMEARATQVRGRVAAFKLAQKLEITGFGEACPCGFSPSTGEIDSAPPTLALVS